MDLLLREVHPANYTEPLGAQSGKDASMSQRDATGGLNYSFCARCTMPVDTDRGAGDGTVHRPGPVVFVSVYGSTVPAKH